MISYTICTTYLKESAQPFQIDDRKVKNELRWTQCTIAQDVFVSNIITFPVKK